MKKVFSGIFFFFLLQAPDTLAINLIHVSKLFEIRENLNQPSEVAVSPNGFIYVVDGVNHSIKKYSSNGKFISSFGRKGSKPGEFLFPLGIDIDKKGALYIADSQNHRVQIYNSKEEYVSTIQLESSSDKPPDPTDVAVDEKRNRCYVVDNDNHRIVVYDLLKHSRIAIFGGPGTGEQEFRHPFLMSLDKKQHLFIVDVINTRVQILNPEGQFVENIGGWGVEKGQFFRPKGVAVDKQNRVYVSDSYMGVVQVFESSGEFFAAIGDKDGQNVKKFVSPTGLFVDVKNRLFVVEMRANKVSVFQILGAQ